MNSNSETLQTYENDPMAYISNTPKILQGEFRDFADQVRFATPVDGEILELGSASGRDADYLQSHGHKKVIRTDATQAFVDHMNGVNKDGKRPAYPFNILTDELPNSDFDTVLANAVMVHFTRGECAEALERVALMLKPDGVFAFSLKIGEGEEWSDHKMDAPRYFNYWQPEELVKLVEASGYDLIDVDATTDGKWLFVIARKPTE